MDYSEEWKALFPIGSVFEAPLLLSSPSIRAILGPLFFNPVPHTLTQLFNSPSLCPPLLNPSPRLSVKRFLSTSTAPECPILASTASSVASLFGNQLQNGATSLPFHNRLQLLRCPHNNTVIAFFPTGCNHDEVGFLLLSVREKNLVAIGDHFSSVYTAKKHLGQRIVRILVNPVMDLGNSPSIIGYLLVSALYSVHWYSVKVSKNSDIPTLVYIGCKNFKSSSVVGACWNPHLSNESVALLENGGLFLFNMESDSFNGYISGTRLAVIQDDPTNSKKQKWLGCEFSWHPRILVVARFDAVFLVDLRYGECRLTCLAMIDMFGVYAPVGKERFRAFSKAVSDHFHFVLVSDSMLVLCDVRKPLMPLLQWAHGLHKPCYVDVFRLSELRANSKDNTNKWATLSGFGIIAGSFWNCEFSLFCYGPPLPASERSMASEITKTSKSIYAWELPSDILLSGHDCRCGSCSVGEEFFKDLLPKWIDWQQKKDIVLGFGILSNNISSLIFEPDDSGGFTLIRLTSLGKLELQRYCASWGLVRKLEVAHKPSLLCFEGNLLHSMGNEEYKFPKRFKYINLDYLYAYLSGSLSQVVNSSMEKPCKEPREKESFDIDIHEILCKKLQICGFNRFRVLPAINIVFSDMDSPSSVHEVALRRIWAGLPVELLQLAFSSYSEVLEVLLHQKKVSLEYLAVPDKSQLPPYFLRMPSSRSTKWSPKVQPCDGLVGPVLPLPILLTLHGFRNGCPSSQEEVGGVSFEDELRMRCSEVVEVARELAVSDFLSDQDNNYISLADDREHSLVDSRRPKSFCLYHPVVDECSTKSHRDTNCLYNCHMFASILSKLHEGVPKCSDKVEELFNDLCPIDLKIETSDMSFSSQELKTFNLLKRRLSKWQEQYNPYKGSIIQ
uniref:Uncharacterized protein MANES_14G172500 n=1 Tax=Rhizophora mucronata TaxID=61149 RepID=A0A2P2JE29_RHIMU